ncbi:MAG TPA: 16S rRNA (uracil(1498)-N(3))-methyltransferase [Chryseolinea sp.]|nr:16S rRNA (uracil(1498)-N(3))-methyltransferase [Chryseolinea sp.]
MNLFYQPLLPEGIHYLDSNESRHVVKVLRKKKGDTINITDGKGKFYKGVIVNADSHQCSFDVAEQNVEPARNFHIHIGISPTKNSDRIEWFIEKAVELGVNEITLIQCDHTERQHLKVERLEKMAISAMKQSLKASLPVIHPLVNFRNVILSSNASEKYIAHVDHENPNYLKNLVKPGSSYLVLIGPEGDFSEEELILADTRGFTKISLGPSRLRTETAGIAACHILNLANTP